MHNLLAKQSQQDYNCNVGLMAAAGTKEPTQSASLTATHAHTHARPPTNPAYAHAHAHAHAYAHAHTLRTAKDRVDKRNDVVLYGE
jgi:hypothetical protein